MKMGQSEVFLKYVAKIVDNLTVPEESTKVLGPHSGPMIEIFLGFCLESDRSALSVGSCMNVIINLIKCSRSTEICNKYIDYVLSTYPKLHGVES